MLFEEYQYDIEINSDDPQADQPDKITVPLKPHQRAALHKALVFEKFGKINYNLQNSILPPPRRSTLYGELYIKSNIAILADVVGYGKTLTALSLIAANKTSNIHNNNQIIQSVYKDSGFFSGFMEKDNRSINYINTTFVIVPRGPVYTQWQLAIESQTSLKAIFIDSLNFIKRHMPADNAGFTALNNFFKEYDLVVVKNTTLKVLMEYYNPSINDDLYHPLTSWDRIMIDEAHDIINKIPLYNFKFLWLISATYQNIIMNHGTRGTIAQTCLSILNQERLNILLVKGKSSFVMQSFNIPEAIEHIYLCKQPTNITAVQPFLSQQVQERLNANDIQGAIREMGGTNETEDDIVELVTREIKREIHNKQREIEYISSLDISIELKEHRTLLQTNELNRLKDKLQSLVDRVTLLAEKTCPICYDNYNSPIMIECTHIFCGQCLIGWIKARGSSCPSCRTAINSRSLTAIVSEKQNNTETAQEFLSKEDTLIKLLNEKTDAKFLVFSRIDSGFFNLIEKLTANNISYGELKGSTSHMNTILDRFKNGQLKVILLNTYYAGSGIDISFATDVVIFHAMGLDRVQAIGRAQRQGRTTQLHIHTLMYPHEVEQDSRTA